MPAEASAPFLGSTDFPARVVNMRSHVGRAGCLSLIFSPRFEDRSDVVKFSADLRPGSWDPATVSAPSDNGTERTVTDTAATETSKFYRMEITKPQLDRCGLPARRVHENRRS